ncbi:MAG TPA: DNA mismatch repair endonuclease MutL, partial [Bacteroidota bacterium]
MPSIIHILPESLASKIAAGEVVQRPASVAKELLENALDAGSSRIVVSVKDGGKSFIQVADDGCGMGAEDARTAFARHATSKISSYSDLENIQTLGFRGEALYSVAAVSHVELKTKTPSDEVGTLIRIEGGSLGETSKVAMQPGTTVTVKNLFYNVPARRNFLKSTLSEFRHVSDSTQRIVLSRNELTLSFLSNDEKVLDVKPETLEGRLKSVFGGRFVESLIELREKSEFLEIHGYCTKAR